MPLSTPTPIPRTDANPTGVVNRRAASRRQGDSLRSTEWPLLTRGSYNALVQGDGSQVVDMGLKRLAAARASIHQSLLLLDAALQTYSTSAPGADKLTPEQVAQHARVHVTLRGHYERVEKCVVGFPLTLA